MEQTAYQRQVHRKVKEYGLLVFCLICGWHGRHFTHRDGRLRHRHCPGCEWLSLRSMAWCHRYPQKAEKAKAEARQRADMVAR